MRSVRRRLVLVAVVMTMAATATANAQAQKQADVRVVPNAALCGQGQTLIDGPSHSSCVHSMADANDARLEAQWRAVAPAAVPVKCYGDGQTGPRVQLIYGYLDGERDRSTQMLRTLRDQIAPRMQAVVLGAAKGRDLGLRFAFEKGCARLSVPVVKFPRDVVSGKDGDSPFVQFGRMIAVLQDEGFDRQDRKYEVIWDWWNAAPICGLGERAHSDPPGAASESEGLPTVGARTGVSGLGSLPLAKYSAVWKLNYGRHGKDCWEIGQSHALGEVHELMHTLGAVSENAPHSDGGGHCVDTPSIMCPFGTLLVPACGRQRVEVLDCNADDFFNPDPAQGSYLATHLNVATSSYLGPQPQDQLSASPI